VNSLRHQTPDFVASCTPTERHGSETMSTRSVRFPDVSSACDHAGVTAPFPVRLEDPGVPELLRDFEALRTWEVLRGAATVCTIPDLVRATSHEPLELHRQLDLLTAHGLVRRVRPRRPRTTIGYRTTSDRIVVTFDETSPESMTHAFASSEDVGNEFERCVEVFKSVSRGHAPPLDPGRPEPTNQGRSVSVLDRVSLP
jgi:hypothetical protein